MTTLFQKICFLSGGIITLGFGIWHLFVPRLYKWFSYIPEIPSELKNAITATNFFLSLALILFGILSLASYYSFRDNAAVMKVICQLLTLLWIARFMYQVFNPQGTLIPNLKYYMLIAFIIPTICFAIAYASYFNKS